MSKLRPINWLAIFFFLQQWEVSASQVILIRTIWTQHCWWGLEVLTRGEANFCFCKKHLFEWPLAGSATFQVICQQGVQAWAKEKSCGRGGLSFGKSVGTEEILKKKVPWRAGLLFSIASYLLNLFALIESYKMSAKLRQGLVRVEKISCAS